MTDGDWPPKVEGYDVFDFNSCLAIYGAGGPLDGTRAWVPAPLPRVVYTLDTETRPLRASIIGDPDHFSMELAPVHSYELGIRAIRTEVGRAVLTRLSVFVGGDARIPARSAEGRRPENPEKNDGNSCSVFTVGYYRWAGEIRQPALEGV